MKRIVAGEIAAEGRVGAHAELFDESVGVGWYHLDLHPCVGNPHSMFAPTLPFQIPLGALLPRRITNLLTACKNIGTTHITDGAYRLHLAQNIGETAGALAAYCCTTGCLPREIWANDMLLRHFQHRLLARRVPLAWTIDIPLEHPLFIPAQMLVLLEAIAPDTTRFQTPALSRDQPFSGPELAYMLRTTLRLTAPLTAVHTTRQRAEQTAAATRAEVAAVLRTVNSVDAQLNKPPIRGDLCAALAAVIEHAVSRPNAAAIKERP